MDGCVEVGSFTRSDDYSDGIGRDATQALCQNVTSLGRQTGVAGRGFLELDEETGRVTRGAADSVRAGL